MCLSNCNGYNNAVKILNEICKTCYSNSEYNAVSRSLNIDDIENVLDKVVWEPKEYSKKGLGAYLESCEYTSNICYPYIYSVEDYSNIDNAEIAKGEGIQRSSQGTMCNADSTYQKANTSMKMVQTAWSNSKLKANNFTDEAYYYMIFKNGKNSIETQTSYFLASRGVDLDAQVANFSIFEVSMGKTIQTNTLFNSRGGSLEYWDRIRPVVEIPRDNIKIDQTNDGLSKETALEIIKK